MTDPDITGRLDPALHPFAAARTDLSPDLIPAIREALNGRRRAVANTLDDTAVEVTDSQVQTTTHPIPVRIYRGGGTPAPAVLYCHAGAFVLGNLDTDHRQCLDIAKGARCTVISVDYRLAPEYPFPAAADDVLAVLEWVCDSAGTLGIDAERVAVAGSSAGGALAAQLAQKAAVGAAPAVLFQLLHQPVLDDRPMPSKVEFGTTPGFDGPATAAMWRHYFGGDHVPAGAVPGRASELSGLASALITCSELDPLRDEAVDYALRLMWAGVATELHVYPGTCHGFDSLLPDWATSRALLDTQVAALRRAFYPVSANSRATAAW